MLIIAIGEDRFYVSSETYRALANSVVAYSRRIRELSSARRTGYLASLRSLLDSRTSFDLPIYNARRNRGPLRDPRTLVINLRWRGSFNLDSSASVSNLDASLNILNRRVSSSSPYLPIYDIR